MKVTGRGSQRLSGPDGLQSKHLFRFSPILLKAGNIASHFEYGHRLRQRKAVL
jgi:hypothetical protein